LKPNSGVNPPYSPAYPVEWGCALRTVEIMTRVEPSKVASLLADTPFEIASDRVAFRFMISPGHSMAVHAGQMFDLMITVPVRYKGLFTETHIFMYCSDPMGICAGREVFGYTKKDAHYAFDAGHDLDRPQRAAPFDGIGRRIRRIDPAVRLQLILAEHLLLRIIKVRHYNSFCEGFGLGRKWLTASRLLAYSASALSADRP
jgi:acetoacetate decarboxylase